jgi:GDPmannose 4,6-dehydratase
MLNHGEPQDFIIATGLTQSLRDFLKTAFDAVNLDWNDHVQTNPNLLRPSDPLEIGGVATKAKEILLWEPEFKGENLVRRLVKEELNGAA